MNQLEQQPQSNELKEQKLLEQQIDGLRRTITTEYWRMNADKLSLPITHVNQLDELPPIPVIEGRDLEGEGTETILIYGNGAWGSEAGTRVDQNLDSVLQDVALAINVPLRLRCTEWLDTETEVERLAIESHITPDEKEVRLNSARDAFQAELNKHVEENRLPLLRTLQSSLAGTLLGLTRSESKSL